MTVDGTVSHLRLVKELSLSHFEPMERLEKLTLYRRAPTVRRRILRVHMYQRNGIAEIDRLCRYRGTQVQKRIMCVLFEPQQRYRDIVVTSPSISRYEKSPATILTALIFPQWGDIILIQNFN